jgi:hypothetical protein
MLLTVTTSAPTPSADLLDADLINADLIDAVRAVDGVRAVASSAEAGVLRVELADGTDEKAVGAMVDTVLQERFGLTAEAEAEDEIGPMPADGRLSLERLVLTTGRGARAEVLIGLDGRSASGAASTEGATEAIATALLLSLEELTEDAVIGTIENVREDSDGVARVRLRLDVDGAEVIATGEAAVVRSRAQAVVRALLVAIEPHLPE